MCGRFSQTEAPAALAHHWGAEETPIDDWVPTSDHRPTQATLTLLPQSDQRPRRIGAMRWGWSRSFARGRPLINARIETAGTKSTYAQAYRTRRCLVPAGLG